MRDLDTLFDGLSQSRFRRKFRLSAKDASYLSEQGLAAVLRQARELLGERLAPAEPPNDGRQTPWRGHPVFVAQHATATCCRSCLEKWHEIPRGRALTTDELSYVLQVLSRWLTAQPIPTRLQGWLFELDDEPDEGA